MRNNIWILEIFVNYDLNNILAVAPLASSGFVFERGKKDQQNIPKPKYDKNETVQS